MHIADDDLTHPAVIELVGRHLAGMHEHSPPESVFALDVGGLRAPGVTFVVAWDGDEPIGCGAIKQLDDPTGGPPSGELKSMRTADAHLRRGVGASILDHLVHLARTRGYARVCLETGTGPAFDAAHALYRRAGFVECGAFGEYVATDFSRYFALDLADAGSVRRCR
ncbi:MAG: GNAT family N-acetyltransferase [Acidimicrobiales bacterium]|nr:GNAT family N-acetyltransferase [Acidimicrobiales bacterium]